MKRSAWSHVCCASILTTLLSAGADAASYGPVTSNIQSGMNFQSTPDYLISLAYMSNTPAVAYLDQTNNRVVYATNDKPDGSGNWIPDVVVSSSGFAAVQVVSLGGNPGVALASGGTFSFYTKSGSWSATTFSVTGSITHISAAIVNGRPAVAVSVNNSGNKSVVFGINANAQGTGAWTTNTVNGGQGEHASLAVIGGKPAVLSATGPFSSSLYSVNSNADGSGTWGLSLIGVGAVYGPTLIEVAGVPSGVTVDGNGNIFYMRAPDASGGGNWSVFTIDGFGNGGYDNILAMALVDGRPAVAYRKVVNGGVITLHLAINTTINQLGPWEIINFASPSFVLGLSLAGTPNRPSIACMSHDFFSGTNTTASFIYSPPPTITPQSVDVGKDTPKNFTVAGSSAQGNALTFRALTNGSLGLITGTSPNFTYTPIGSSYGPDQAPFVANDGLGEGLPGLINFTKFNGPEKTWIVENTDSTGPGSLNFMMQLSKSGHSIKFDPNVFDLGNSDAATVISLNTALPSMTEGGVTIDATDRRVTVNGSGAGSTDGFYIASDSNVIQGLAIVGFERSGINIVGGHSNIIGGSRAVGANPNGQGLRISNCGSFGIQLSQAASGNVVKGCWVGLSPSGNAPDPNLAGILIKDGSTQNIIGSTVLGEANAISGNTFEGIVVSDSGSDGNQIIGNVVGLGGASAAISAASRIAGEDILPTRAAVANGSSGVFISRGTRGTKVGGAQKELGNVIARNGGSGVEVRVQNTIENSATSNQITQNTRGGISLFDGSNNNVQAPAFAAVSRAADDPGVAGQAKVNVSGTALTASGVVELFSDVGNQGGTLVGRIAVSGNVWSGVVDVSDLENITATFTDDAGNTSPFAVFGRAPDLSGGSGIGGGTSLDSDKDGVADILETLAGTNAFSAAEVPVKETSVVGVDRLMLALRFDKTSLDSLSGTYRIALPAGFTAANASVGVQFGGYTVRETLNEDGKPAKGALIRMRVGRDNAGALLQFKARKADLRLALAANGLTDKTTPKEGQTGKIPAAVGISSGGTNRVYVGEAEVTYKSTQGKSGKAKLVRKK